MVKNRKSPCFTKKKSLIGLTPDRENFKFHDSQFIEDIKFFASLKFFVVKKFFQSIRLKFMTFLPSMIISKAKIVAFPKDFLHEKVKKQTLGL
jgi:hypothetical protein